MNNNNDNINDCINELTQLFNYETIDKKEDYINNWGWCEESFNNKFGSKCLFVINCEFIPRNEDDIINIHYDLNYWGSNEFNKILKKYGLNFEWFDNCSVIVFNKVN